MARSREVFLRLHQFKHLCPERTVWEQQILNVPNQLVLILNEENRDLHRSEAKTFTLLQRRKLVIKCRHENNFYLMNFKTELT